MIRLVRPWLVFVAALVLALGVVACGGDDKKKDNGAGGTATVETGGDSTPATGTDGSDGNDGTSGSSDLEDLAKEVGTEEVKVSYTMTTTAEGETTQGTITLYWKPEVGYRVDFSMEGSESTLISANDANYICSDGQCLASDATSALPIPFLSFLTDPSALSEIVAEAATDVDIGHSERSIGGQDADCFTFQGTVEGDSGEGEYCFGGGVLLLLSSSSDAGGEFSLEATSVESSVSDADLEPPYPVLDLGDVPGAGDVPNP